MGIGNVNEFPYTPDVLRCERAVVMLIEVIIW